MDSAILVLLGAGLITGFSKFSVGGMGMLILPVLMIAYTGPESLGILVPMYILTDLVVVSLYRKGVNWGVLLRLLPLQIIGMVLGSWLLADMSASVFTTLIGSIIIGMLLLGWWLENHDAAFMRHPVMASSVGLVAGVVSMTASAAGPLLSLYMLEQKMSKEAYISTRAFSFLIIDLAKIPLLLSLGYVNLETTLIGIKALPAVAVGALLGFWMLRRLALTQFKWIIRGMAAVAAIKLFVFS